MANWDELKEKVERTATRMENDAKSHRDEMLNEIEAAKRDEILTELKKVNTRLDAIESRLPPEDPEEPKTTTRVR